MPSVLEFPEESGFLTFIGLHWRDGRSPIFRPWLPVVSRLSDRSSGLEHSQFTPRDLSKAVDKSDAGERTMGMFTHQHTSLQQHQDRGQSMIIILIMSSIVLRRYPFWSVIFWAISAAWYGVFRPFELVVFSDGGTVAYAPSILSTAFGVEYVCDRQRRFVIANVSKDVYD